MRALPDLSLHVEMLVLVAGATPVPLGSEPSYHRLHPEVDRTLDCVAEAMSPYSTKNPRPDDPLYDTTGVDVTFTYSVLIPDTDGVTVNVTTPVPCTYPPTVQLLTCVLDVFRKTAMFAATSVPMPGPLRVRVCAASAVPTVMLADSSDVCVTPSAAGRDALRLLAIVANVIWSVPVAAVAAEGVNVNATCVTSDTVVPEPDVTVPDDVVTLYAVPAAIDEFVVAVMLVDVPTAKAGCEKLTVVGNL